MIPLLQMCHCKNKEKNTYALINFHVFLKLDSVVFTSFIGQRLKKLHHINDQIKFQFKLDEEDAKIAVVVTRQQQNAPYP